VDRSLPARPSLESLRKQAKKLLRLLRARDPEALERLRRSHPRPPDVASLREAQLVVAREYGFVSWAALKTHAEGAHGADPHLLEQAELFVDLACLTYSNADSPSRRRRAARLLETVPGIVGASIHAAAVVGDLGATRRLLDADPALATRGGGPRGWVPLLYLCYGRVDGGGDPLAVARLLLERGADPNSRVMLDQCCFTALTGAMGEGERGLENQPPHPQARALAIALLEAGADPNDSQGLYNTMFRPSNEWLELLLAHGLTASHMANWSSNAMPILDYLLGQAVKDGFDERVALLLARGAGASGRDAYDHRTHHENAVIRGRHNIAELLVRHGATSVALSPRDEFRAAYLNGDIAAARALIAQHPEFRAVAAALIDAAEGGHLDAVQLLLDLDFPVDARTASGETALHHAALRGHLPVARLLVERGAPVEVRDMIHHDTPVGWAAYGASSGMAERGQPVEVIGYLLDVTRDPLDLAMHGKVERLAALLARDPALADGRDANGNGPLHALRDGTPELEVVIDLLCRYGADVKAVNARGETPLDAATAREDRTVAAALQRQATRTGEAGG
jgi:ankyrin repeat protein